MDRLHYDVYLNDAEMGLYVGNHVTLASPDAMRHYRVLDRDGLRLIVCRGDRYLIAKAYYKLQCTGRIIAEAFKEILALWGE